MLTSTLYRVKYNVISQISILLTSEAGGMLLCPKSEEPKKPAHEGGPGGQGLLAILADCIVSLGSELT